MFAFRSWHKQFQNQSANSALISLLHLSYICCNFHMNAMCNDCLRILYKNTLARPDLAWAAQMTGHAVFNQVQVCCDEWNVKADEIGLFGDEHLSTDDAPTLFSIRPAVVGVIADGNFRNSLWLDFGKPSGSQTKRT